MRQGQGGASRVSRKNKLCSAVLYLYQSVCQSSTLLQHREVEEQGNEVKREKHRETIQRR